MENNTINHSKAFWIVEEKLKKIDIQKTSHSSNFLRLRMFENLQNYEKSRKNKYLDWRR